MATKVSKKKDVESTEVKAKKPAAKKKTAAKKTSAGKTTAKKTTSRTATKKKATVAAPQTENNKIENTEAYTNGNANPNAYLIIDYPVEAESICSDNYVIRMGASQDGYVEVSFNNGEWNPCRFDDGYWWFDWVYLSPGEYNISARLVDPQGNTVIETSPRKCKIC